jgi:hypothetical protein
MKALRLPARASAVTYWFRSGGPRFTPFVSASLRSRWQGDAIEPGFLGQPVNPRAGALLRGRKTGPLRFAGDPSHAFAKLHDPGRTDQASPLSASSMLPPPRGKRRLRRSGGFRGLPLGFDIHCLRFTSAVADTHAKLVSGWLAGLCRERVELPGSLRRFPITS